MLVFNSMPLLFCWLAFSMQQKFRLVQSLVIATTDQHPEKISSLGMIAEYLAGATTGDIKTAIGRPDKTGRAVESSRFVFDKCVEELARFAIKPEDSIVA